MTDDLANTTPQSNAPLSNLQNLEQKTLEQKSDTKVLVEPDIDALLDIADDMPVVWIREQYQLAEVVEDLATCGRVALDTEFIKRDTYYPRLALVQLNTGNAIYLLDAPKLRLADFWQAVSEVDVAIWHACGEDLGIFYLLSGCPPLTNIFDTQMALAYLTGQLQMGYQQALADVLDMHIDKEHSQSDWLVRPLTEEQEDYAIDDVRYLPALYLVVEQQLKSRGLYDYVWQDCQLYAAELYEIQHIEDEDIYLGLADYRYTKEQLAILQAVSAWREALARATNQPRTFVIKKQAVREIITEQPSNLRELAHKTTMHRSMIRLYGEELLTVIKNAKKTALADQPDLIVAPYRSKDKALDNAVQEVIKAQSDALNIPRNVLMRKKWLNELYEFVALEKSDDEFPEALMGWRYNWVKAELLPVIENHKLPLQAGMGLLSNQISSV